MQLDITVDSKGQRPGESIKRNRQTSILKMQQIPVTEDNQRFVIRMQSQGNRNEN